MGIRILSVSDLHIGHNKVSPMIMYRNITKFIYPLLMGDIDILLIIGDFFHKLCHMDTLTSHIANQIIAEIISLSVEYQFKIRIVRGTFHHDRDQLEHFESANAGRVEQADLKLFSTMSLELIEDLGLSILYVPDDLPYDNAQSEIVRKIKEYGLERVSLMAIHGYCKHEIPADIPIQPYNCFDSNFLEEYVEYVILKGHVHSACIKGATITNGSLERMEHGQEEKKGFFLVHLEDGKHTYKFVENTDTYIFRTIVIDGKDIANSFRDQVSDILKEVNDDTPLPIYIRYVCDHSTHIQLNPRDFDFDIDIRFSHKLIGEKEIEVIETSGIVPLSELPKITKSNVFGLLAQHTNFTLSESFIREALMAEEV